MKKNRLLTLAAAAMASALLMLAGCSTAGKNETAATPAPTQSQTAASPTGAAAPTDDKSRLITIKVASANGSDTLVDNTLGQKQIEEAFNVKLVPVRLPAGNADEKLGVLFASGEQIDVITGYGNLGKYVDQGVVGEIDEELMKQYMPKTYNLASQLAKKNGIENMTDLLKVDGKIYALPYVQESAAKNAWLRAFRMDILREVGFDKIPETIDDYDAVFKAVKAKYPNMYMIGGAGKDFYEYFAREIQGAYSQAFDSWIVQDGKVVNASVVPEAKQYLAKMAEWFKAGYIDPEWLTDSFNTPFEKFANGKLLTLITYPQDIIIYPTDLGIAQPENTMFKLKSIVPQAEIAYAPPVKGPTGRQGNMRIVSVIPGPALGKKFTEDPANVIRYMQIAEESFYGDAFKQWRGVEGEHFQFSPEGYLSWINGYDQVEKRNTVYPYPFLSHSFTLGETPSDSIYAKNSATPADEWFNKYMEDAGYTKYDSMITIDVPTVGALPPEVLKIGAEDPTEILKEYYDAIIYGVKSVDTFDEMVEKWYANGGKERTEWKNDNAILTGQ